MKKEIKEKALNLRKKGESYKDIVEALGVSKSTLSLWFKNVEWSKEIKERLIDESRVNSRKRLEKLNNKRSIKLEKYYQQAEQEAKKEFQSLKNDKLFLTAISLYWGEGDRSFKNGIVRISNVDPVMLRVFRGFLLLICKIKTDKIRAGLLLYPDLNEKECVRFWSEKINIASDLFFKSTVIQRKEKKRKVSNGVCIVSVHNKFMKKKVLTWLELFKESFHAGIV
jgi:transcriptional regulator with XRE-family HTH domain